jgi:hypothetical protein
LSCASQWCDPFQKNFQSSIPAVVLPTTVEKRDLPTPPLDHLRQKFPNPTAGNGEVHIFCPLRDTGRRESHSVAHSHPRGFFAGVPKMVWKIAEPRNDGIEHRNIDQLTAIGFFPLVKREENAQSGIHSRGDIGDRQTGPGRLVRIAGGGNDPPFSLDEEIIGLDVPVGTVLAIAGERAIDEPWIDRAKRL